MPTIPAPTLILPREEWPDADFDLPEGVPIHAPSDKDDDEDWDLEMEMETDIAKTGCGKANTVVASMVARYESSSKPQSQIFNIRRPPPPSTLTAEPDDDNEDDDDDEGVSTIKVAALPKPLAKNPQPPIEDDFEDALVLPSGLTQLSLAPLSLNHRSSKNSLEWGDKDQTSSSQSSDAYSCLGFADASPSSNSTSSASLPESETEEDEEDDELEGLIIPSAIFESGHGGRQLTKILEMKKAQITNDQVKVPSPDPEDDFEMGLVIDDDVDLSPSRLLCNTQQQSQRHFNRSNSVPPQRSSLLRPPSRLKSERAKSPFLPPTSSARQLQKLRLSPSPPLHPPTRSQNFQALSSASPTPVSSMSFLSPKPGSLRGQKSHSGLKPPTPPSASRKLTRKASLSSLIEASNSQASGSGSGTIAGGSRVARYEEPTAASRAKAYRNSTNRTLDFKVPPTRPHTPSSNPAALRLTMPTQSRLKSRPPLCGVFTAPVLPTAQPATNRATSPLPLLPLNISTRPTKAPSNTPTVAPKVLRRPKRQRTYGDGTELDGIEDLPTDREKEGKFRVQPKGYGNRIPGATYSSKSIDKGTMRKKGRREGSNGTPDAVSALASSMNTSNMLKRTTRIEFSSKLSSADISEALPKKKKNGFSPGHTRRKPTLIRNLGGSNAPKVVGDMKWNPHTLRWEGNDHILRDFDAAIGTSTRPALITHITGSSIGSPSGSFTSGTRIVGNMIFDAVRMCWISTLPPDEDEPDVFANLADDEEDGWESKGGTIRASLQQPLGSSFERNSANSSSNCANSSTSSEIQYDAVSPAHSHTRTVSESGSDRCSRGSMIFDVDETFLGNCKAAEERHCAEMKGWKFTLAKHDACSKPDRSYLYEIRALATRKY